MRHTIRGFWSIAAIAAISVAIITGFSVTNDASATEHDHMGEDHSRMSETEHKNSEMERKMRESSITPREDSREKAEQPKVRKEATREKLSANKLKACEKRQANIKNHTVRIADRGTKHVALFTKIADRVKAFYVAKGSTLENYDALVSDVDAKKIAAEAAVQAVSAGTSEFTCTDGNPKQSIEGFKAQIVSRNAALKDYQTAVKNLIISVKSVNSTTTSASKENE